MYVNKTKFEKKNSSQEYYHMTSLRKPNIEAKEVHSPVLTMKK